MSDARSDDQVIRLQIAAVKMDELDRLRAEVAELRNCAVLSDQENDRLNGLNARLRDELVRMEEQRNVLRELVREAKEYAVLPASLDRKWNERAEKALNNADLPG